MLTTSKPAITRARRKTAPVGLLLLFFAPAQLLLQSIFFGLSCEAKNNSDQELKLIAQKTAAESRNVASGVLWQQQTANEKNYRARLEACEIQYGLNDATTVQMMWQLAKYYLSMHRYADAAPLLKDLKDVCDKNKSKFLSLMPEVLKAYSLTQGYLPTAKVASGVQGVSKPATIANLDFRLGEQSNRGIGTGESPKIPVFWETAGHSPQSYKMGIEPQGKEGTICAYIKSVNPEDDTDGALSQAVPGKMYWGKRIRFSGFIKTKEATSGAFASMYIGCWDGTFRYDGNFPSKIVGSRDWTRFEFVLDVPQNANLVKVELTLAGVGQAWFDGLNLEEVTHAVPVTSDAKRP